MAKNEAPKQPIKPEEFPSGNPRRRKFSLKRRIMQRVIIALLFSGGIIAAQEMGWLDNFTNQFVKKKVNWLDNSSVVAYLKQIVTDHKLTQTPPNCLIYVINNDNGGAVVNIQVREQHNAVCTNTRTDFPILFTFRVNRPNGSVEVDKNSPNHFYLIH